MYHALLSVDLDYKCRSACAASSLLLIKKNSLAKIFCSSIAM